MEKITTIIFDMYGVILEESKGRFIPYTFERFDTTEHERLERQFKKEQLFTKAGNGEITSDDFLSMLGYEDPQYHMKNYIENYLTLEKIGRSPSECVFIDNSVKNLEVAAEVGIHPILFNRDKEEYTGETVNSFAELAKMIEQ